MYGYSTTNCAQRMLGNKLCPEISRHWVHTQIAAAAVKAAPQPQKTPAKKSSAKSHDEKVCQRCGEQHPLRYYPIRKQQPDGRDATCRACALEIRQAAKPQRP